MIYRTEFPDQHCAIKLHVEKVNAYSGTIYLMSRKAVLRFCQVYELNFGWATDNI